MQMKRVNKMWHRGGGGGCNWWEQPDSRFKHREREGKGDGARGGWLVADGVSERG